VTCLGSGCDDGEDVLHGFGLASILGELLDCLDLIQFLEGPLAHLALPANSKGQQPLTPPLFPCFQRPIIRLATTKKPYSITCFSTQFCLALGEDSDVQSGCACEGG
jgi:hypothetical protein